MAGEKPELPTFRFSLRPTLRRSAPRQPVVQIALRHERAAVMIKAKPHPHRLRSARQPAQREAEAAAIPFGVEEDILHLGMRVRHEEALRRLAHADAVPQQKRGVRLVAFERGLDRIAHEHARLERPAEQMPQAGKAILQGRRLRQAWHLQQPEHFPHQPRPRLAVQPLRPVDHQHGEARIGEPPLAPLGDIGHEAFVAMAIFRAGCDIFARLADRRKHLVRQPALELFGYRLPGGEDQAKKTGLRNDNHRLRAARGTYSIGTPFIGIEPFKRLMLFSDLQGPANVDPHKPGLIVFRDDANQLILKGKIKEVVHGSPRYHRWS